MKYAHLLFLSLLILLSICFTGCKKEATVDAIWALRVANENLQCPIQIDEITVLDSCKYIKNRTMRYYYTITEVYEAKDVALIKECLKRTTTDFLRTEPRCSNLREASLKVEYFYFDKNRKLLTNFVLTADEYKDTPRLTEDGYVYSELTQIIGARQEQLPIVSDDSVAITKIELSYPPTISQSAECSTFILTADFDSIQFKQERQDFMIEDAKDNIYATLFPGARITYRHIYYGKGSKYLCTLVVSPDDYLKPRMDQSSHFLQ